MGAELSPANPNFPKLEVAKDPELMREVFQRHLRPLDGKTYQVRECSISYVHHRRTTRCVLQYTLRLAEPESGRERSQWVSGVMYSGGRTRRIWEQLRRTEPGRGVLDTSPTFAPFSYIPDLEMMVQVFPFDHLLPALPLLVAGPLPDLEPLLLARFGPGDWRAEDWKVKPVRYRVGQRAALRLTVKARDAATGRAEKKRFYAKVYREGDRGANLGGEKTYQALLDLWDKASAGDAGFTVGRPIAYLSGLRTLVQEEVPGTSLWSILFREEDQAIPAVRKAARALAALHLEDVVVPQRRRLQDEIARLERAGDFLQSAYPYLGSSIEEIIGVVVAGLEEVPLAPTHGDLKSPHMLVDGDSVALIDFDKFSMADPLLDVVNLLYDVDRVVLYSSPLPRDDRLQKCAKITQAFVDEYFAQVPEAWRARLPLHYAAVLLKKEAGSHRRGLTPDGSERIEAMLEKAKDCLETVL